MSGSVGERRAASLKQDFQHYPTALLAKKKDKLRGWMDCKERGEMDLTFHGSADSNLSNLTVPDAPWGGDSFWGTRGISASS